MNRGQILRIVVTGASLYFSYTLTKSLLELYRAQDRVTTQQRLLQEAEAANLELRRRLEEVRSLAYLEKEARESLNMQLPGETVVILDQEASLERRVVEKKERVEPNWRRWFRLIF